MFLLNLRMHPHWSAPLLSRRVWFILTVWIRKICRFWQLITSEDSRKKAPEGTHQKSIVSLENLLKEISNFWKPEGELKMGESFFCDARRSKRPRSSMLRERRVLSHSFLFKKSRTAHELFCGCYGWRTTKLDGFR